MWAPFTMWKLALSKQATLKSFLNGFGQIEANVLMRLDTSLATWINKWPDDLSFPGKNVVESVAIDQEVSPGWTIVSPCLKTIPFLLIPGVALGFAVLPAVWESPKSRVEKINSMNNENVSHRYWGCLAGHVQEPDGVVESLHGDVHLVVLKLWYSYSIYDQGYSHSTRAPCLHLPHVFLDCHCTCCSNRRVVFNAGSVSVAK